MVLQERTETGKTSSARLCSRDLSLRAGFPHSTGPPIATSATVHCTGLCQGTWPSGYAGTPWTSSGWYRRFPSGMPKFSPGTYQPISTGYRPALSPPTRGGGGARSAGEVGVCEYRSPVRQGRGASPLPVGPSPSCDSRHGPVYGDKPADRTVSGHGFPPAKTRPDVLASRTYHPGCYH